MVFFSRELKSNNCFRLQIHVDGPKFDLYTAIPGMSDFVTSFGEETKIHSCHWKVLANIFFKFYVKCATGRQSTTNVKSY